MCFPFFSLIFLPCSTSISFRGNDTSFLDAPLLFSTTTLYIVCHDEIFHFYLSTAFGSYECPSTTAHWPTGCPTTTIALNVLAAPLLIPRQNGLSCFLFSSILTTLIWIKIEPLPHLPLWHASSGPLLFLLLLGEMSSQQDISPKEVSTRTLK